MGLRHCERKLARISTIILINSNVISTTTCISNISPHICFTYVRTSTLFQLRIACCSGAHEAAPVDCVLFRRA